MATPLQATERQNAFFHSLSKATTNSTQYVFESKYKSAHSVKGSEIWADVISYCADSAAADAEATANAAVEKYTQVTLTEIPGSNGQAWYINNAGTFVRPWISPVDVPNSTTNAPSDGFQANLYTSTGTLVTPTAGVWFVDYYAGIVHFEVGSTPVDLGYGTPKITCYVYTGAYGAGTSSGGTLTGLTDVPDSYATHAGKYLVVNNTEDGIEFVATGVSGSAELERTVAKTAHGLVVGNWITGTYTKGNATTLANSEVIGVVTEVVDTNTFKYQSRGFTNKVTSVLPSGTLLLLQDDGSASNIKATVHKEIATVVDGGLEIDIKISIAYDGATVATSLASLTDATITTPISGQYLTYNGTKWVNSTFVWTTANVSYQCGETIGAYKVCVLTANKLYLADSSNMAHISLTKYMTIQSKSIGELCEVVEEGSVAQTGWGLSPDIPYFLGTNGDMQNAPPSVGFIQRVAVSETADRIYFDPQNSIKL